MAGQTINVSVLADTGPFARSMKTIGRSAGLAVGALAVAVGAFVGGSIKAAQEAEVIGAQTEAVLKSTGAAAGKTADEIGKLATKLSNLSGVDDEAIQGAENLLLTFTRIQGVNFDKATEAALNLSVAMGTDINSAALQVGKALNDPIKGITSLSRAGIQFTEDQKATIRRLVEIGDTAGAQQIILKELETQFGGSAEAYGRTFEGSIGRVKTAFGNLQEQVGGVILPALTTAMGRLADKLSELGENPTFNTFLDKFGTFAQKIAEAENPLQALKDSLLQTFPALQPLAAVFTALEPVMPLIAAAFADVAAVIAGELKDYAPQIATAFVDLLAAVGPLIPKILELIPAILPLIPPLIKLVTELVPPLVTLLGALLPPAIQLVSGALDILAPIVVGIVDQITEFTTVTSALYSFISGEFTTAEFNAEIAKVGGPIAVVIGLIQKVAFVTGATVGIGISKFREFATAVGTSVAEVGVFMATLPGRILGAVAGFGSMLYGAGRDLLQGLVNGISSMISAVVSKVVSVGKSVVSSIKGALGIKSPSRVFKAIGSQTLRGLELGLAGPNRLSGIMSGLSDQVVGNFSAGLAVPGGYRAGASAAPIQIIFNGVVTDPVATGREVQRVLDEYSRTTGGRG